MRRTLLATFAIMMAGSVGALAADLPQRPVYKAPVMVVPPPAWTGCYIGGNIGGAFGDASASSTGGTVSGDGSGFAGGGQVGCDYQFSGGWVIGLRDMFDGTSNKKSGTFPAAAFGGASAVANFNNQWFDTLTGRLLNRDAELVALLSGRCRLGPYEYKRYRWRVQFGQTSNTRTGWTIGGGAEWMFAPHWSAFLEGNYMDFGSTDGSVTTGGVVYPVSAKATETTVLVGVNYRFF